MAIYREDFVDIDLAEKSIHRSFLPRTIGEGDQLANRFGVRVLRNGEAVAIGGTCAGYFIRPSGDTVPITGTVSGNTAYVDLPQACYAYEGQFALAIKVTSGSATGTMRIIDGVVANTTTDTLIDPGTIIPTIDALLAAIEAAVATVPLDYSALSTGFQQSAETEFDLSDPGTWDTKIVKASNGQAVNSTTYKLTSFMPVTGETIIFTTSNSMNSAAIGNYATVAFYADNTEASYISCETIKEGGYTYAQWATANVPDGAKYMRIMIYKDITDQFKCIQVNKVALDADAVLYRGAINSSTDIDTLITPGMWYANNTSSFPTNWPTNTLGSLIVSATKATGNNGTTQTVIDYYGRTFVRYKRSSAWQAWNELAYMSNFDGVPIWNLIDSIFTTNLTNYGLTFTKTASGTFHVQGTKGTGSGLQEFVIYRDYSSLPDKFKAGSDYCICVSADDTFVQVVAYYNNTSTGSEVIYRSPRPLDGESNAAVFRIPATATGISVTVRFDDASSFNEDVTIYILEKASMEKRYAITKALAYEGDPSMETITNIIADYQMTTQTVNGVTGSRTGDDTFYFTGTKGAASWTTIDLYRSKTVMPAGFEAGKTYEIYLNSYDVSFWVVKYSGADDASGTAIYKSEDNKHGEQNGEFTIPSTGVAGLSLAFKCENAASFDETVTLIISEQKSAVKREFISAVNGETTASDKKMYSLGNSFLTGVVYTNGSQSGICTWKDAIYGQIAMALGISQANTNHIYHGNTGFIVPSTTSPFIYDCHADVICDTDLSAYDFCLTHFNGSDLRKTLGTVNADGTGTTLADAVVRVVNHIKTNKWICKLIILGTPPYSSDYAGPNIFITPQGTSGNSIDDMDNLMYKLAIKHHFIYVSWQDLEISYHYMDFADYHEGDTGARHADSVDTYRALGEYAGTQIPAVASAIAIRKINRVV